MAKQFFALELKINTSNFANVGSQKTTLVKCDYKICLVSFEEKTTLKMGGGETG